MRLLPFRIGAGDLGPRLAQPKTQLPEQALALAHAHRDAVLLLDPDRQRLAIPQIAAQARLPRRLAKSRVDLFQLLLIQAPRPPSPLSLAQTCQALALETVNPILHRPRRGAQQPGHLGTGHSLRHKQHTVEPVVVAGILGAPDFILQSEDDAVPLGYAQWSHALMRTHPVYYTQLLMTLCLDRELERRGHRFCRYADDCNIYVRSRRAGERVMAGVCKFLTKKLRLKVNESKSAVARPDDRKFLGFRLTTGAEPQRLISPQALRRFQARVRELTSRTRGVSIERMVGSLKPYLLGWRSYFGFSQDPLVLRNLDARIRRRLRMVIWRQWVNGPARYANLRRKGVPHMRAAVAAGSPTGLWAMSRHAAVQQALPNAYFDSLGLPRLSAALNA